MVDGRRDAFGYSPFRANYVTTGKIVTREARIAIEGYMWLEGLKVFQVTSVLSQEWTVSVIPPPGGVLKTLMA
jgi:hypothetical protein